MKAIALSSLLGLSALVGCNAIDRASDCSVICNKWKDCANSSYDVSSCSSRCRDNAANSDDYDRKVDTCRACVDGNSCVASAFQCSAACSGIVP